MDDEVKELIRIALSSAARVNGREGRFPTYEEMIEAIDYALTSEGYKITK